ncbi:unnamed protein product [Calypogeia fissa]
MERKQGGKAPNCSVSIDPVCGSADESANRAEYGIEGRNTHLKSVLRTYELRRYSRARGDENDGIVGQQVTVSTVKSLTARRLARIVTVHHPRRQRRRIGDSA